MEKKDISILSSNEDLGLRSFLKILVLLFILSGFGLTFSCGKTDKAEPKSETNLPPVIASVGILPEKPNKESQLNLIIQSNDPNSDPITYRYQWMRNEEEIVGENKSTLSTGDLRKGDLIRVRVTPFDGKVEGEPFLSPPVEVLNSPPVVQKVWIEPKVAYVNGRLKANVTGSDVDGDIIYYTYQWGKNGVLLDDESGEILEQGRFKRGESIAVIVTPDDRETQGLPKKSEPVTISNSPPMIASFPPTSTRGSTYLYQVRANDPDDDPITFTLKKAPKGMEIGKETGLIRWVVRKEDKGAHLIEIEAADNEGAKGIQRYTLTVEFK
jgi:hypothetical protein